jgi:N-terminal domain of anti-restriction factor ArdC
MVGALVAAGCPGSRSQLEVSNMARRQPTAEQKAAAVQRRERFTALAKHVAAMSEDDRAALVMKVGAIVTCEGRALSVHNSCLVLTQRPTASMVGGFRQWQAHGRSVKKGERGLMIWVPTTRKDDATPTATEAQGAGEGAEEGAKRAGFVMGTVFDVSQTEPTPTREANYPRDHAAEAAGY